MNWVWGTVQSIKGWLKTPVRTSRKQTGSWSPLLRRMHPDRNIPCSHSRCLLSTYYMPDTELVLQLLWWARGVYCSWNLVGPRKSAGHHENTHIRAFLVLTWRALAGFSKETTIKLRPSKLLWIIFPGEGSGNGSGGLFLTVGTKPMQWPWGKRARLIRRTEKSGRLEQNPSSPAHNSTRTSWAPTLMGQMLDVAKIFTGQEAGFTF